jgi:hypothetical protein
MPGSNSTGCANFLAEGDQSMQVGGSDALAGDLDCRFDHREDHAFHAVTEQAQIAPFGVEQALVRLDVGEVDIASEQALELGMRGLVSLRYAKACRRRRNR